MRIAVLIIVALSFGCARFEDDERVGPTTAVAVEPRAVGLTTNARIDPVGIPADDVSFSWANAARGWKQSAYEIRVGTLEGSGDVWHSGRVESDRQVDIRLPVDRTLAPATRYYWQVRTWNDRGEASDWSAVAPIETGLLSPADWHAARWIARPQAKVAAEDWKDYRVEIDFSLHDEAIGLFLRATTDGQSGYMYQVNVTEGVPVLKVHEREAGNYREVARADLSRFGHTNDSLRQGRHSLVCDVSGPTIRASIDGVQVHERTDDSFASGVVGFRTHGRERGAVHRVRVTDVRSGRTLIAPDFAKGESGFSAAVVTAGALEISGTTDAVYTAMPASLPLLRGVFDARAHVKTARLYASSHGIYELSLNGRRVGDQHLAPGWTDYPKRVQHQTYDVTHLVKKGSNAIGAMLADGWYRGNVGLRWSRVYGDSLALIAAINVTYDDGSTEWFTTGGDWRASDGPFVRADLQDGERYDAAREQRGWNTAAFDAGAWQPVEIADAGLETIVPQPDEPIRAVEMLSTRTRTEPQPGRFVYDLGQNMVGVARVTMTGRKGQIVTIRHAEELYRTGDRKGQLYTDNFRAAAVTDTYTFAADGTATYQPTFTQHGFRYIEISGLDAGPSVEAVKGVVFASAIPAGGELVTSAPMLNQLVSNIRWGMRGNFLSIPTDTPARDERLGWTGDISVFAPTAARFGDVRGFLSKWMDDMRDAQRADGNIPAVVPQPRREFSETGVGWSDAFITVPYAVWQATGDPRIVRRNWDAMQRFYRFVHESATHDGDLLEQGRRSWFSGDWLTLDAGDRRAEHEVIATVYFAENTRMMAEMAAAMGDYDKAAEWAALVPKIREAFVAAYRKPDGSIAVGSQTAYAMALGADMINDDVARQSTAEQFVRKLAADDHHLRTGFLGTPWLLPALSKVGRNDLAMRLLLNEDYPSWGYEVRMGATTVWERWNSIGADGAFGPVEMNSFNHYAYGAVGDWMFANLGGLQQLEPGYKKSRIAPLIGFGVTHAESKLQTPYGELACRWRDEGGTLTLTATVPANTTAEIEIPCADLSALTVRSGEGNATDLRPIAIDGAKARVHVGGGVYELSAPSR